MFSTFPPSASGPSGGADGANRQFHYASGSEPDRIVNQVVFEFDPTPVPVAVFDLADAVTGDELTIYVESTPATAESHQALVIPAAFTDGSIRIVNKGTGNFFLCTADSLGSPFQPDSGRAPGVCQVLPGTTEFLVASAVTAEGYEVVQVNSLRAIVKTTSAREHTFTAPAADAAIDFHFPFNEYGNWLLDYDFARSVRVYADELIDCKIQVIGWDATSKSWANVWAEATWATQASGAPNFGTISVAFDLPKIDAGNGSYSMILPDSIVRITLTAFPGDAPTFATVVLGVKTLRGFD
jgi:hypothetical protein